MNGVNSIATTPAMASGRIAPATIALRAPSEWPTSTTGPRPMSAARSAASRAYAAASNRSSRGIPVRPWPRWSMATQW
jgi:hypothetical protein